MVLRVPMADDGKHGLAAVAYILTWLTGIIVYLIADDDDTYTRWHALQAILFGIAAAVIGWILGLVPLGAGVGIPGFGVLAAIWWLLVIIAIIVLAVKAYKGEKVRIPVIADLADDHA